MAQVPPVCCADPSAHRKPFLVSTGLPSPPSSPADPAPPEQAPSEGVPPAAPGAEGTAEHAPGADAPGASARRWAPSPSLGGREIALVCLGAVALAILTTWPLVLHMSSRIAPDLGDPVRTAWEIAWVGHAMLHSPLHLFDSNAFYPHPLSLAFSDSLLGYGPTALVGSGTVAALVRYNLLFLFAYSLCLVGAYLLARELGLRRLGSAAAGIAFAYAPYRVTEAGHLHVISSGGIPLALFLLLRGYRRASGGLVLAGWLVSAWQVSLGFTLGMQYAYLLAVLAVLLAVAWWRGARAGRPPLTITRRLAIFTAVGVVVLGAITIYQARPYLRVSHIYPTAKRTIKEVENYSSGPAALLSASSENRVWGGVTSGAREHVHSKNEDVFFPGGLILLLARARSSRDRRLADDETIAPRPARGGGHLLGARDGPRADRRRVSISPALRLRARLERRAGARTDLHAGHALLRAARGRRRAVADRAPARTRGTPSPPRTAGHRAAGRRRAACC